MKYYLIQWEVQDSENGYFVRVIGKANTNNSRLYTPIDILGLYYGFPIEVLSEEQGGGFQLESDYRIIKFESIKEINKNIAQLGKKHFGISIIDLDELDIPF